MKLIGKIKEYRQSLNHDPKKKNRFFLLIIASVIIFDYLLISLHIEHNPLAILPSLPTYDARQEFEIFLPDTDGKNLLAEKRMFTRNEDDRLFVKFLVQQVVNGSSYENTRIAVPRSCDVRTVWLNDGTCVIDLRIAYLDENAIIIPGSELNFKNAVEKTVKVNVPGVTKVYIVENGIYNKELWETATL